MNGLLEIIDKDLIINPLTSAKRDEIIAELVDLYARRKGLSPAQRDEAVKAVIEREELASTAMEKGIAIPHAKLSFLEDNALVIGVSRIPVDFGGEQRSRIFFLLLASADKPSEHIQILSSIAKLCSSDVFVRLLSSAKTPSDVYQLFFD